MARPLPHALRIASVVVNWNGIPHVRECVRSLVCQEVRTGWQHVVVVVDNASSDGSVAVLDREFPDVLIIERETNGGFGAGANQAFRDVDADVFVLVNNDAWVEEGFVDHLVAPLTADPGLAATTATVVLQGSYVMSDDPAAGLRDGTGRNWRLAGPGEEGVELMNSTGNVVDGSGNGRDRGWLRPRDSMYSADVFGFHGGACALRRDALVDVGPFDESLFMYYEDTDLSWRFRRAGWRIHWADAAVSHHAHATSSGTDTPRFVSWNTRNRVVVAAKNAPWQVVLSAVTRSAVGALTTWLTSRRSDARTKELADARVRAMGEALLRLPGALRSRRRQVHQTS